MSAVSKLGYLRTRLDERLETLKEAIRGIFGEDIDLDDDTIDGETLGIYTEALSNLDQLLEDVYHCLNPQSATGVGLSRLVELNGISRIGGTYSVCDVVCVGQYGTVIPAGSLIKSETTAATFETTADVEIDESGQALVSCRATEMGAKLAPAQMLNKIDTPIYGWQSVSNPSAAIVGRDEETDEALRFRRSKSTATPSQGLLDGLYGALANLPSVRQCKVYENDTGAVQPVTGLPPHSLNCVVEGGGIQEIVDTIWLKKSSGVTQVGAVTGTVIDSQGNPHTMRFDRPDDVLIWATINISTRTGWPTDGADRIKTALCAWAVENQEIGEELIQSRLYDCINTVPAHSITSLLIGTEANPSSAANIAVQFNQLARFDPSRIVVNVA